MNILQILQLIAALMPGTTDAISKIMTAIHSSPGSAEHVNAVNTVVVPSISTGGKVG